MCVIRTWCARSVIVWLVTVVIAALPAALGLTPTAADIGRNIAGSMTGNQGTQYFRSAITQQNMQTILAVIEERLRGLDSVYAARGAATQQLDTCTRRLDAIEGKIDRLESVIELRLDKLSEAVGARSLKDQLNAEHVGRAYDNLQHRMDMASVKLQTIIESGLSRVERGQMQLAARQADAAAAAAGGWTATRSPTPPPAPAITNATADAIRDAIVKPIIEKISSTAASLNNSLQDLLLQQQQNDETSAAESLGSTAAAQTEIRASITREATTISNKMTTMYVELWRRGQALEALAKDGMAVANATRREFQDGLRALMLQLAGRRHFLHHQQQQQQTQPSSSENSMEQAMDTLSATLQKKITESNRKMDTKFQEVILAQNLFLESCHRIQLNEPQLESKVHDVLDSLLKQFINITTTTYNDLQVIQELVKSRNSQVSKGISHVSTAVVQLGQRQHEASKSIMRLLDDLRVVLSSGSNGNIRGASWKPIDQRMSSIMTLLQEIQEQLTYAEIQRDQTEKNNTNLVISQLSKQISNAVSNATAPFSIGETNEKQDELFSLVDKLIDMTNKLDAVFLKLEDRVHSYDKDHATQFNDDNYEFDDLYDKYYGNDMSNITSPTELINKLRQINAEENRVYEEKDDSFNEDKLLDEEFDYIIDTYNHNSTGMLDKTADVKRGKSPRNHRRHPHRHPFDRGPVKRSKMRDNSKIDILENDDYNVGNHTEYIELSDPDYDNDDIEYPIGKSDKIKVD